MWLIYQATSLLAVISVGLVVGWYIGQSGSDTGLLVAAIPVLLSGVGMILFYKFSRLKTHGLDILLNIAIVFLFLSLYIGTLSGVKLKEDERIKYLEKCAILEYELNIVRDLLGLDPLKPRQICSYP